MSSKYDSPYYQENPNMAARGRELETRSEQKAVEYRDARERLRTEYKARHHNGCPVFKAHRIPFESCGTCNKAFEEACDAIR